MVQLLIPGQPAGLNPECRKLLKPSSTFPDAQLRI
jgi:hypothetical protein